MKDWCEVHPGKSGYRKAIGFIPAYGVVADQAWYDRTYAAWAVRRGVKCSHLENCPPCDHGVSAGGYKCWSCEDTREPLLP